jgi:hypothetical protein
MAKRMSLRCPECEELVAGFGRKETVASMARHLRIGHAEMSEARKDELVRRPWQPCSLADAAMVTSLRRRDTVGLDPETW